MKCILGTKIGMTQVFKADGTVVPVTIVRAEPCVVTQVKTTDKEGYESVQLGAGQRKAQTKTQGGHLKGILATGRKPLLHLREVCVEKSALKVGDLISIQSFAAGDKDEAVGTSKGKGFQGVVKRHHFHGQPATRGS